MSKPVNIWFPTYIGDFFVATANMTGHEVGAYQIIKATLWKNGGSIPADDKQLAKLVKASARQWKEIKETLWPHFEIKGGLLTHPEVTSGLARATAVSKKNSENAKAMWAKKGSADGMRPHSERSANAMLRASDFDYDYPIQEDNQVSTSEAIVPFRTGGAA